jgi:gas vesicle protein GvpA/GvpJ/GvpM family
LPELASPSRSTGLVEILDRVLDKGLVIAGDIKINLANVELLTIQIRLLVCSIDKAEQIGMNWWRYDPRLTSQPTPAVAATDLNDRLDRIERQLAKLSSSD